MNSRYAIYFSPEIHSPWWTFGAGWIGRDEHQDTALPPPSSARLPSAAHEAITAEPRRYGFHATLKAPFRLAGGTDEASLLTRVHALAKMLEPLPTGPMRTAQLEDFIALVPESAPAGLDTLARSCVLELDDLRAPLSEAEIHKRRPHTLDERGRELLERYGYQHVLDRFRLHMTLTGPVTASQALDVQQAVAGDVARLNAQSPLMLDRLCVFREAIPGAPFRRIADALLGKP